MLFALQQGQFGRRRSGGGGGGGPTEAQPSDTNNVMLLIHGDTRPWLDQSPTKKPVANYQLRAVLASSRVDFSDTGSGLYVFGSDSAWQFGTGSWFVSASVNSNYGTNGARLFDTRPSVGSASGWSAAVDTSRRPFIVIEGTTYGTGTPAANLLLTNDTTHTVSFSYDGTSLRCFVDGSLSWTHTVSLNIDTGSLLCIGNTNPFSSNAVASTLADMIVVKGESVATASFTVPAAWNGGAGDTIAAWNPATQSNIKLLVHGSTMPNASTTFVDSSGTPKTLTANGNVQASTAQKRLGTSSILFDGSSDYISTPDSADWDFGTGDYSLEAQIRVANAAGRTVIANYQNTTTGWVWQNNVSAGRWILNETGDGIDLDSGVQLSTVDTWGHVCAARVGGFMRFYYEGELAVFAASSQNITGSTSSLLVGALPGFTGSTGFNGYMQEIRVVKGEGPARSFSVQSSQPLPYSTWNAADKDADITLSNGDRTAAITAAAGIVRGTRANDASLNRYFELTNKNASTNINFRVGVAKSTASLTGQLGSDIDGWGMASGTKYNNGGSSGYDATNCIIGVKADLDAGTVSFVRAGVDIGTAYSSLSGTFYPAWGPGTSGVGTRAGVLNTGGSAFVYGLPSGYTAWGGTWNSADKDADVTLSGSDLVATVVTALGMVRGTQGRSSGKYYFEVEIQGADRDHLVGIANSSASLASYPGNDTNGWAYYVSGRQRYNNNTGVSYKADEVWGVAVNSGSISVIVDGYNRGTMYSGLSGSVYPAWGPDAASNTYNGELNTGGSPFVYALPGGASAWE